MVRAVVRVDGLNRLSGGVGSGEWGAGRAVIDEQINQFPETFFETAHRFSNVQPPPFILHRRVL